MTKLNSTEHRHELSSRQQWVALGDMRVSPHSQRDLSESNPALAKDYDPDLIGHPVVSKRGDHYYILDGQHRVEGFRRWIGEGWRVQQVLCDVYADLTEAQEAELFLRLNDVKAISTYDKFQKSVNAGRDVETDIDRIVRAVGLKISKNKGEGTVSAVGTLRTVYTRGGPATLSRTLRIISGAYGDHGLEAPIIAGIGLVTSRFNGEIDDVRMVERLANVRAGADGLLSAAYVTKKQTASTLPHCVAAAAVDIYNRGRGGKKLPSWWKAEAS